MPFSIAYNGPAPVDTYFIMRSAETCSTGPTCSSTKDDFDPISSEESSTSFRGRYLHGKKIRLPDNYKISFFQLGDHSSSSRASTVKLSHVKERVVRAPVRGSRFSLDEDNVEDEVADVTPEYTEETSRVEDTPTMTREYALNPVYHADSAFWIWNPDGPIDTGGDPFIQTCHDWLLKLAPAVSSTGLT